MINVHKPVKKLILIVLTAAIALLIACNSENPSPDVVTVQSVEIISVGNPIIEKGSTLKLDVKVNPDNATDQAVSWSSNDESVASVDENGLVTGISAGETTITAAVGSVRSDEFKLTVVDEWIDVERIEFTEKVINMVVDDVQTIQVIFTPEKPSDMTLDWSSSASSIAKVSENGEITAVSPGRATVTAKTVNGLTAACEVIVSDRPVIVEGIVLNVDELTIASGGISKLTAHFVPSNAETDDAEIVWSSSDEAIVTVDSEGNVVAKDVEGSAIITVTVKVNGNEFKDSCSVTVKKGIETVSITINGKAEIELNPGDTYQIDATITPDDAEVMWSSDDDSVSVDDNGLVSANHVGEATITVIAKEGGTTATCHVKVNPVAVDRIEIAGLPDGNIYIGESFELTAEISPDNATDKSVNWSTSDPAIATVDDGHVELVGTGEVAISATSASDDNKTDSVTINVLPIEVTSVTLSQNTLELNAGDFKTLSATVFPANATDKTISWSSDNPDVAFVDENGKITGIAEGIATITAEAANGKSSSCVVSVKSIPVPVSQVSLDKTSLSLTVGRSETLTATVYPANASDSTVTWSSSDSNVASVEDGVVTAVSAGTAIISAGAGGKTATCTVSVSMPVSGSIIDPGRGLLPGPDDNIIEGDFTELDELFDSLSPIQSTLMGDLVEDSLSLVVQEGFETENTKVFIEDVFNGTAVVLQAKNDINLELTDTNLNVEGSQYYDVIFNITIREGGEIKAVYDPWYDDDVPVENIANATIDVKYTLDGELHSGTYTVRSDGGLHFYIGETCDEEIFEENGDGAWYRYIMGLCDSWLHDSLGKCILNKEEINLGNGAIVKFIEINEQQVNYFPVTLLFALDGYRLNNDMILSTSGMYCKSDRHYEYDIVGPMTINGEDYYYNTNDAEEKHIFIKSGDTWYDMDRIF